MIPILILKIGAPKSDSLIIELVLKMSALALKFLEKKSKYCAKYLKDHVAVGILKLPK